MKEIAEKTFEDDPKKVETATAKLFPFGSYTLGVMATTSDIDCICVTPKFVKRERHFFGELVDILDNHPHVEDLTTVQKSKVPLIKMKF